MKAAFLKMQLCTILLGWNSRHACYGEIEDTFGWTIAQSLPLICMPGCQDHHAGQSGGEHALQCHSSVPSLPGSVSVQLQGTSRDTSLACSHHSHLQQSHEPESKPGKWITVLCRSLGLKDRQCMRLLVESGVWAQSCGEKAVCNLSA